MAMAASSSQATTSKERGNAAFKAGDYAAAVGHYTAAILADPSDATFFLNRAAAYLKLSKNQDAERDCTTVLTLSKKNVKALFRRAQARVALQKLGEAHNDLQTALKLEPNNEAVKAELARVDDLIVSRKGKSRSPPIGVPTSPPTLSSSPTVPPKRRRIPITIVDDDDDDPPQPSTSAATPRPTADLLNPVSSRVLSSSTPPDGQSTPAPVPASAPTSEPAPGAAPVTPKPKPPASFKEAKQARDTKSVGRVGGGIFRVSGNDTVFKTREVPARATAEPPPKDPAPAPAPARASASASTSTLAPALAAAARASAASPRTLFEFTRAWDGIPVSDTAARWALLNTIPPTTLPALVGASLEPALLASLIPVLAAAADSEQHESTSRDTVKAFMCALARVPRFRTVVQFLSRAERSAARAVWDAVTQDTGDDDASVVGDAEEVEEKVAHTWGFAHA
ncbi:hypothetical protein BJV74DRAFT_289932 [Russula compacta]|nr:hypothetical protein BJV74DRAFT_289932 [Russula compacta]